MSYALERSTAHVLGAAVLETFPNVGMAPAKIISAPGEGGFFCRYFELPHRFDGDDLDEIADRMTRLCDADVPFECKTWNTEKALDFFDGHRWMLDRIAGRIACGQSEVEVCVCGPLIDLACDEYVESTSECANFALTDAGDVVWRNERVMFRRINGRVRPANEENT